MLTAPQQPPPAPMSSEHAALVCNSLYFTRLSRRMAKAPSSVENVPSFCVAKSDRVKCWGSTAYSQPILSSDHSLPDNTARCTHVSSQFPTHAGSKHSHQKAIYMSWSSLSDARDEDIFVCPCGSLTQRMSLNRQAILLAECVTTSVNLTQVSDVTHWSDSRGTSAERKRPYWRPAGPAAPPSSALRFPSTPAAPPPVPGYVRTGIGIARGNTAKFSCPCWPPLCRRPCCCTMRPPAGAC